MTRPILSHATFSLSLAVNCAPHSGISKGRMGFWRTLRAPSLSHVGMVGDVVPVPSVSPIFDDRPIVRVLWIWLFLGPLRPRCISEEFETSRELFVRFCRFNGFFGASDSLRSCIADIHFLISQSNKFSHRTFEGFERPKRLSSNSIGVPQCPQTHAGTGISPLWLRFRSMLRTGLNVETLRSRLRNGQGFGGQKGRTRQERCWFILYIVIRVEIFQNARPFSH